MPGGQIEPSVFVIAGARRFSLGAELVDQLASLAPLSTILAIDVEPLDPPAENVLFRRFNLNPFDERRGFGAWSAELHELLHSVKQGGNSQRPVRALFLGAGKTRSGDMNAVRLMSARQCLDVTSLGSGRCCTRQCV